MPPKAPPPRPPPPNAPPSGKPQINAAPAEPLTMQLPSSMKRLPARLMISAVEGWGKTTLAAMSPDPVFLLTGGETGLITLAQANRVPDVPFFNTSTFEESLAVVQQLLDSDHDRKTLTIDATGGLERQVNEYVVNRYFDGDWGEKGFAGYGRGHEVSVTQWLEFQEKLDELRQKRNMLIILLSHSKIKTYKNPIGEDFDRFISDLNEKNIGSAAYKWCDDVLFGQFLTVVDKDSPKSKKGKGIGGAKRVLYCERRDAFDAKNRRGMPPALSMPEDHNQVWSAIGEYYKC